MDTQERPGVDGNGPGALLHVRGLLRYLRKVFAAFCIAMAFVSAAFRMAVSRSVATYGLC